MASLEGASKLVERELGLFESPGQSDAGDVGGQVDEAEATVAPAVRDFLERADGFRIGGAHPGTERGRDREVLEQVLPPVDRWFAQHGQAMPSLVGGFALKNHGAEQIVHLGPGRILQRGGQAEEIGLRPEEVGFFQLRRIREVSYEVFEFNNSLIVILLFKICASQPVLCIIDIL